MAHHNTEGHPLDFEPLEQWTCPLCNKTISSTRPPVYNSTNCCSAQVATYSEGAPYGQTYHTTANPHDYHVAPSNASTNLAVSSPEGIETDKPNLIQGPYNDKHHGNGNNNSGFLQLGPEPSYSLNQSQARRSSSFHNNPPYTLQSYLQSPDSYPYPYRFTNPQEPLMNGFISQGVHFQAKSSMLKERSSRKSRRSGKQPRSGQSSWSGEASRWSWEVDEMTGVGGWLDDEGNYYCGAGGEGDGEFGYEYPSDVDDLSD